MDSRKHLYLPSIIASLIGVAGVFGGVYLGVYLQANGKVPESLSLPTTTPTAAVTTTVTATVTTTPPVAKPPAVSDVPSSSSTTGPGSQTYRLSEMEPIETVKEGRRSGCTGGCTGFTADAARIGGTIYPRSWLLGVDADGARSSITFNPSKSCRELRGSVGLSDKSSRTEITIAVEKDGSEPEVLATAPLGEAKKVKVDLNNVATFTLSAYISGSEVENATAVLGDMVMTCEKGSRDPL